MTVSILHLKKRIWCSKQEPVHVLLPLWRHMLSLNDGNCRLTTPVVEGPCGRDPILHTFNIGIFDCGESNSIIWTSLEVMLLILTLFGRWNPTEMVPVLGMGAMSRPRLRNAQDTLTPGIRILFFKLAVSETLMPFPTKIHTDILWSQSSPRFKIWQMHRQ